MKLSRETIDKMLRRLKKVDDEIDAAKVALSAQDAAGGAAAARRAADQKHRVVDLCPKGFVAIYDIFFYLDLAERSAVLFPNEDPDVDSVIEDLEQSLEDIEYFLEDEGYSDAMQAILEDLAEWLRAAIAGLKKNPPQPPANDGTVPRKKEAYFDSLDPSGVLKEIFNKLDSIDELLFWARTALEETPPDFAAAGRYLGNAEQLKHALMRYLEGLPGAGEPPPDPGPGGEDLPPRPDHA
jgi:hypothetical protein